MCLSHSVSLCRETVVDAEHSVERVRLFTSSTCFQSPPAALSDYCSEVNLYGLTPELQINGARCSFTQGYRAMEKKPNKMGPKLNQQVRKIRKVNTFGISASLVSIILANSLGRERYMYRWSFLTKWDSLDEHKKQLFSSVACYDSYYLPQNQTVSLFFYNLFSWQTVMLQLITVCSIFCFYGVKHFE